MTIGVARIGRKTVKDASGRDKRMRPVGAMHQGAHGGVPVIAVVGMR